MVWAPDGHSHFLDELQLPCSRDHEHVGLSGWRPLGDKEKTMMSTKNTAHYPGELCEKWSELVMKLVSELRK
jgi:hypothetical protein